MKHDGKAAAVVCAILAAALYSISTPFSKVLLKKIGPMMMASLLYLGAGIGMFVMEGIRKLSGHANHKEPLSREDMPYTVAMVVLDIAAPILLKFGIELTSSANVSLMNNFEIVATTVIAFFIFKEKISLKLLVSIVLVTISTVILSFEGNGAFDFNVGSLFVLGACICWGFENNSTRMLSHKSSEEVVIIKGLFSGLGSLVLALLTGEKFPAVPYVLVTLLLGFVAYGLSINLYVTAQKDLGAARTSAFYSVAPFLGVGFSMIILSERPSLRFFVALAIMVAATILLILENKDQEEGAADAPGKDI